MRQKVNLYSDEAGEVTGVLVGSHTFDFQAQAANGEGVVPLRCTKAIVGTSVDVAPRVLSAALRNGVYFDDPDDDDDPRVRLRPDLGQYALEIEIVDPGLSVRTLREEA